MDYRDEVILTGEEESELLQEGTRDGKEREDPDIDTKMEEECLWLQLNR